MRCNGSEWVCVCVCVVLDPSIACSPDYSNARFAEQVPAVLGELGFTLVDGSHHCDGVLVLNANKTKVGTLVRVETSSQAAAYRLTVKASDADIATAFAAVLEGALRTLGNQSGVAATGESGGAFDPGLPAAAPAAASSSGDPVLDIFADL